VAQFPYLLTSGFESGATNFDTAITDTESKSSYPHYTTLAQKYGFTPYRGAYCWLVDQSTGGGTTTAVYQTQAAFNVTATNYWSVAFAFYAKSTTMADGNRTSLVWANSTKEFCLQLYYTTAGGLQLLLSETAATAVGSNPVVPIEENKWHWIELYGVLDPGSNDGTASLVYDGVLIGTVTSLDQASFTDLYVGLQDIDAGHTAGLYAFDDIYASGINTSAVRIGYRSQFPTNIHVSAPASAAYGEHLFLGPGTIKGAQLLTAAAGDNIRFYDTDRAYTTGTYGEVAELDFSAGVTFLPDPIEFSRGCYCLVTPGGAAGARGLIQIDLAPECGRSKAMYYGYPDNLKRYAITTRQELTGNR
jgi:hypothetical protein